MKHQLLKMMIDIHGRGKENVNQLSKHRIKSEILYWLFIS